MIDHDRLFKELLTYLKLSQTERARFQAELDRIEPRKREEVMQIVTSWMEEGLQRGRQEGLEAGRLEGLEEGRRQEGIALVLRLLARRVGEVEPELHERIQALELAQIEDLGEALLDFSTKEDLATWLEEYVFLNEQDYEKLLKNDIELMKEMAAKLPEIQDSDDVKLAGTFSMADVVDPDPERAEGAALRALRQLLDEKDRQQHWGGLKKVLTPEGHYLWLCDHHAAPYKQ